MVRQKPGTYQLSENSRKSASDFGEASRQAAYIRKAFAPLLKLYAYGDVTSRLTKRMAEIFKTVPAENAGNKKLVQGNLCLLRGFEFNVSTHLMQLLYQLPQAKVNQAGFIYLQFPKTELKHIVKLVPGADIFLIQLMVFDLGLVDDRFEVITIKDLSLGLDATYFPALSLKIPFVAIGEKALMVAVGISFFKGNLRLSDRRYFACNISHCWHLKDGVIVDFIVPRAEHLTDLHSEAGGLSWELEI